MGYDLASPFGINEMAFYLLAGFSTIITSTYLLRHLFSVQKRIFSRAQLATQKRLKPPQNSKKRIKTIFHQLFNPPVRA